MTHRHARPARRRFRNARIWLAYWRARHGRHLLHWAVATLTGSAVLAGAVWATTPQLTLAMPAAASPASCQHISGPFHRRGNGIYNSRGRRFIPYGIVVTGLGSPTWAARYPGDAAQIRAAAASWCSNTVRLQVFQGALVSPRYTVNKTVLADVRADVTLAESLGLVVELNDQSEGFGPQFQYMPDKGSRVFWKALAGIYGHDSHVVFDLFNEPRHILHSTTRQMWNRWLNGGTYGGRYWMGMQPLARYVRGLGVRNLFIVEGPQTAGTLAQVPTHQVTKAGPVMYGINHTGPVTSPHTPAAWNTKFGNASRVIPMTDTEWTNYATATRMCWANAPRSVPAFLHYLAAHHMGLTAWTLTPGVLVTGPNLASPTRIRSNWACRSGLNEGAGHQIMQWIIRHNGAAR